MACEIIDSFDHYSDAEISGDPGTKWAFLDGGSGYPEIQFGGARTGPACLLVPPNAGIQQGTNTSGTQYVGSGFYFEAYPSSNPPLIRWLDSEGAPLLSILITPTGTLKIKTNTDLYESSLTVPLSQWVFIDAVGFLNPGGSGEASVTVYAGSGPVEYLATAGLTVEFESAVVRFMGEPNDVSSDITVLMDDTYINTSNGSANTASMGGDDFGIHYIRMMADEVAEFDPLPFTPVGAGSQVACINQQIPDGDTTYNLGDSTFQQDFFRLQTGTTGPIDALQMVMMLDGNGLEMGYESRPFDGTFDVDTQAAVPGSYAFVRRVWDRRGPTPFGDPWTGEYLDSIAWSYRYPELGSGDVKVTQFGVEVCGLGIVPGGTTPPATTIGSYCYSS